MESYITGLPGIRTAKTATHRICFKGGVWEIFLPGGKIINGALSRDPLNTGDIDVLRPGVLMGKITASGKYAPTIIGVTTVAYADNDTTLTVSAATATEIVRRVGATGTIKVTGPPSAAGTVSTATGTYTAINTTTGVITLADMNDDFIAGSFVTDDDGTETPVTIIPDGWGIKVTDSDGTTNLDVPFPEFPTGGHLISSQIVNWPSDTSLRAHLVTGLTTAGMGKFIFDHLY